MPITSFYRTPQPRGYSNRTFFIEDTSELSPNYFDITSFPSTVGGGKYIIVLRGNQTNLRLDSIVDIEIVDSSGKNIFAEVLDYTDRFNNYYISFDVYDITSPGFATAYLVGEALFDLSGNPVPQNQTGAPNVRWQRSFEVLPYERNNAELFFTQPPSVTVAQIVTPTKVKTKVYTGNKPFLVVTSSLDQLSIVQSNFQGYDRDFGSSDLIIDPRIRAISVNPKSQPATINSVNTTLRSIDRDIENGYLINYTTRFGTVLQATSSFFNKGFLGGYFEFFSSESAPKTLLPNPTDFAVSGSAQDQLKSYNATIVEVVNDKKVLLSNPLTVTLEGANQTLIYKEARSFTGSISYVPSSTDIIASTNVQQSYLEFTFQNITPAAGEVYRIKSYAKLGSITGEYKQLNDQIIQPIEFLTDASFTNPTNYSRFESEYQIIGQFTTQSILTTNWELYDEVPSGIGNAYTPLYNNDVLIESARLTAGSGSANKSNIFTTKYFQNYDLEQPYTLSFYVVLDPFVELEIYGSSDNLNQNVIVPQIQPKAFIKSLNYEKDRYSSDYNRFGKYIGKIVNDRPTQKYYGRVLFDYETDTAGFGKPVFRARIIDETPGITGSAYLSDISVKSYALNGFTPKVIQYAIPVPEELSKALLLSQSIDFKIDYFDYTGKQSENTTYLDDIVVNFKTDIPTNTCQAQNIKFEYDSGKIEDRLLLEEEINIGQPVDTDSQYLSLQIAKETVVTAGPTNTATFSSAVFASPPAGSTLPVPTVNDFRFYINGQLVEPSSVSTFTNTGTSCTVTFNTTALKYELGPVDVVVAIGKFDPTV